MEYTEYLRMREELVEEGKTFLQTEAGNICIKSEKALNSEFPDYAKYWGTVYKLTMILYLSGTDAEMVGITYASKWEFKHGDFDNLYQEMVDDIIDDLREYIYTKRKDY